MIRYGTSTDEYGVKTREVTRFSFRFLEQGDHHGRAGYEICWLEDIKKELN